MQIFEITKRQPVNEISFNSIASKVGDIAKYAAQAPARAFNKQAGVEYAPLGQEKDTAKRARNAQVIFHQAVYLLTHNFDETAVMARLTGEYGASTDEAMRAIDSALNYIEKERAINPDFAPQMTRSIPRPPEAELGSIGAFSNMTQQLTKTPNTSAPASLSQRRAARSAIAQPAADTTTTGTVTPQTPEQRRIAQQRRAAAQADIESQRNAGDISKMTPAQKRELQQKFAGMMARAQMSGTPATTTTPAAQPTVKTAPAPAPAAGAEAEPSGVQQALIALGYSPKQAAISAKKVPPGMSEQDAIKLVLSGKLKESLTWSRTFDASQTLLKKIKSQ